MGSENPTFNEQSNEIDFDHDCYCMGKEKQGKQNPIPSQVTKEADIKKWKEKEKHGGKDTGKDKPKPPLRSGLGPAALTTPLLMTTDPTTRQSPAKQSALTSQEGAPLLKNMRIDQRTGDPKTSEAEKE